MDLMILEAFSNFNDKKKREESLSLAFLAAKRAPRILPLCRVVWLVKHPSDTLDLETPPELHGHTRIMTGIRQKPTKNK